MIGHTTQGRAIEGVEISIDGGAWQPTTLGRVPSTDTWVQWRGEVQVDEGDHELRVRAIDKNGDVQTGAVRDLSSHPLKLYFNLGLRVTVNTDNRLVTDTTVSKELWLCHTQMGMSFRDIKSMIIAGFKSSFLPFHERHGHLRLVGQELARYDDEGNVRAPSSVGSIATSTLPARRGGDEQDATEGADRQERGGP